MHPKVTQLAKGRNVAMVSTLMPDGSIQNLPLWVDADDEHLLLNTEVHRQKYHNLQKDAHCTVTIVEGDNWYSWVEVRGRLVGEVRGEEARRHIAELSHKYTGGDYANPIQSERVILKIRPEKVNAW